MARCGAQTPGGGQRQCRKNNGKNRLRGRIGGGLGGGLNHGHISGVVMMARVIVVGVSRLYRARWRAMVVRGSDNKSRCRRHALHEQNHHQPAHQYARQIGAGG